MCPTRSAGDRFWFLLDWASIVLDGQILGIGNHPDPVHPRHSDSSDGPHDEAKLFAVIKAAFGNRRKTLKNALAAAGLQIDSQIALQALNSAGIDPTRRAETLKPSEFVALEVSLRKAMAGK